MRCRYTLVITLLVFCLGGLELVSPVLGPAGRHHRRTPGDVTMNSRTPDFDGSSADDVLFYAPLIVVIAVVGILGFFGFRDSRKKRA